MKPKQKEWTEAVEEGGMALLLVRGDDAPSLLHKQKETVMSRYMFDNDRGVGMEFEGEGYAHVDTDAQVMMSVDGDMLGVINGTDNETLTAVAAVVCEFGWQVAEVYAGPLTAQTVKELTELRPTGSRLAFVSGADSSVQALKQSLQSAAAVTPAAGEVSSVAAVVAAAGPVPEVEDREMITPIGDDEDDGEGNPDVPPATMPAYQPVAQQVGVLPVMEVPRVEVPTFSLPVGALADDVAKRATINEQAGGERSAVSPVAAHAPFPAPYGGVPHMLAQPADLTPVLSMLTETIAALCDRMMSIHVGGGEVSFAHINPERLEMAKNTMAEMVKNYPKSKGAVMAESLAGAVRWHGNHDAADVKVLATKVTGDGDDKQSVASLLAAALLHLGYSVDAKTEVSWARVADWLSEQLDRKAVAAAMLVGVGQHDPDAEDAEGFAGRSPLVQAYALKLQASNDNDEWLMLVGSALQALYQYGETAVTDKAGTGKAGAGEPVGIADHASASAALPTYNPDEAAASTPVAAAGASALAADELERIRASLTPEVLMAIKQLAVA